MPLVSSCTSWKYQKTSAFLMFSGGVERDQWHEMGYFFSVQDWSKVWCITFDIVSKFRYDHTEIFVKHQIFYILAYVWLCHFPKIFCKSLNLSSFFEILSVSDLVLILKGLHVKAKALKNESKYHLNDLK